MSIKRVEPTATPNAHECTFDESRSFMQCGALEVMLAGACVAEHRVVSGEGHYGYARGLVWNCEAWRR